jgi:hypothetical protein
VKGFAELSRNRFAYRFGSVVFIRKFLAWNGVANPKVFSARMKEFNALPKGDAKGLLAAAMLRYCKHISTNEREVLETISRTVSETVSETVWQTRSDPIRSEQDPNKTRPDHTQRARASVSRGTADAAAGGEGNGSDSGTHRTQRARARDTDDFQRWQDHYAWALATLPAIYPTRVYTEADWQATCRTVAGYLDGGVTTRDDLVRLAHDFAAQQDAMGRRDTAFVPKPQRHYDSEGKWKGPFVAPAAQQQQRETPVQSFDRALDDYRSSNAEDLDAIDGEVLRGQ